VYVRVQRQEFAFNVAAERSLVIGPSGVTKFDRSKISCARSFLNSASENHVRGSFGVVTDKAQYLTLVDVEFFGGCSKTKGSRENGCPNWKNRSKHVTSLRGSWRLPVFGYDTFRIVTSQRFADGPKFPQSAAWLDRHYCDPGSSGRGIKLFNRDIDLPTNENAGSPEAHPASFEVLG
jgi:hypothetical protein